MFEDTIERSNWHIHAELAGDAARRGASTHMRARMEAAAADQRVTDRPEALAIRRVRETRRALERGWLTASEALRGQGEIVRADEVRRFVRNLPPARTEREWLRAELIDRAQSRREQHRERSR